MGGPAIHTVLLSEALNKDGYKDILVCGRVSESEGDMAYFAKDKNVVPVVIPELGRDISLVNDIKAFYKLYKLIRAERPDIVHTHAAKAGTLGRLAAIVCGVPVKVHTFHGHIFDGYFSPFKARIFLFIEKFLALFTDRVITVSDTVKYEITDKLKVTSADKCVVVPLGLELDKFFAFKKEDGKFRRELSLPDNAVLVGIVGRLVPIKNHTMFLDAAKMVLDLKSGPDIRFVIVGDGELRHHLEDYAAKIGIRDRVIFTGWRKDLPVVYSGLDIVALTSLNEGTPVSIIEAMAAMRPVVSTMVGGVKDIITDSANGYLVKSQDTRNFSEKLAGLITDNEQQKKFGSRGRESVERKYSKERLVRDIKLLYDECLKK